MKTRTSPKIFIYTALPCEAKPLIDFYQLKKDTKTRCFAIYKNNDICITITGIGKSAVAAAVAYTQALFQPEQAPIMLNIGIAGHKQHAIGNIFLAHKLTDHGTGKSYYPPLAFTPPCATANLMTFAKPQQTYPEFALCDMEASAFYETAMRFSCGELIQCLKIVSDNEDVPAQGVNSQLVTGLITGQIPTVTAVLSELSKLEGLLKPQEYHIFNELINKHHFSASEQVQLKKLLCRWRLLKGEQGINLVIDTAQNGKEFLKMANQKLNAEAFYL